MAIEEFSEFFSSSITLEPLTGRDGYGTATYGAAVTYPARIQTGLHRPITVFGQERTSRGVVYLQGQPTIGPDDRLTLPTAFSPLQPPLLTVDLVSDEAGAYYTRLTI